MSLLSIFPDGAGHDRRIYECPRGEHEVTEVMEFKRAS